MSQISGPFSNLYGTTNLWSYNWIFLICWVVIIIAIIFYVYYINRLFAFVLTKLLNFFLFKSFHVIIDIESIDVSLLFGTIHFKNLNVITKDSTISIVRGTFQWKFWMLRTWLTSNYNYNKNADQEKQHNTNSLFADDISEIANGSRNFLDIEGLEIFLYNNTKAYQHIFDNVLTARDREILREKFPIIEEIFGAYDSGSEDKDPEESKENKESKERKHNKVNSKNGKFETVYNVSLIDQLLDSFLPFVINIKKGSLVVGTPCTKYLLVMNWMMSQSLLRGIKSENSLDLYQLRLNTFHENFLLSMEPNPLFKTSENLGVKGFSNFFLRNSKILINFLSSKASKLVPKNVKRSKKQSMIDTSNEWKGLSMYINMLHSSNLKSQEQHNNIPLAADDDAGDNSDSLPFVEEYAKYSKIIECELLSHVYYFDIPGYVPEKGVPTSTDYQGPEVGNSGSSPEMRLDIKLSNAQIFLGPWAYRNILPIIKSMLPTHSRDTFGSSKLNPGDRRIYTRFRLFIDIQDDCILRIPTREQSKDEYFISESETLQRNQIDANLGTSVPINSKLVRPYGWIDVEVKEGSSLFFDFNFYPTNDQHVGSYSFELIEPLITTSVNHETVFTADFYSFILEQYSPLTKKDTSKTIITCLVNNSKCNLLREHVTLLTDLIQDFTVPDQDIELEDQYQDFTPQIYEFNWRFKDGYNLVIASNDENIINIATESSENNFVSFVGDSSEVKVTIPMELFHPNSTTVDFKLTTRFFDVLLTTPSYSTIKDFADNNKIGRGRNLEIVGYYEFFNELNFGNIDNLNLEFKSDELNLLFYGFVIKYFTNLYENLLGATSSFRTAEEYQEGMFENRDHLSDIFSNHSRYENGIKIDYETIDPLNSETNTFADTDTLNSNDSSDDDTNTHFALSKEDLTRKSNELDVFVKFLVSNANLYFPERITNVENSIGLHTQDLNIDIRALDYYFDLQIDAEPIYIKKHILEKNTSTEFLLSNDLFNNLAFEDVEGILTYLSCHNHRFFGPPPIDESYLTKWDFAIGSLTLDTDIIFLRKLFSTVTNFDFCLDDMDNMLVIDKIETYGTEFDSFEIEEIRINLKNNSFSSKLLLRDISFEYNELENGKTSTNADINIETLSVECFEGPKKILTLQTDVKIEKTFKYSNYKKRKDKQKVLLIKNDSPFHRIWSLLPIEFRNYYIYQHSVGFIKPGHSIPSLPIPLVGETVDLIMEQYLESEDLKHMSANEKMMELKKNLVTLEALDLHLIKDKVDEESTNKNQKAQSLIFGTVLIYLDLAHIDFLNLVFDEISKTDCETILDSVYADVVKGLFSKDSTRALDQDFKTTVNGINLNLTNSDFSTSKYLKFNASVLTIDLNVAKKYELQNNSIVAKLTKTVKVLTKKISLNVHNDEKYSIDRQKNMRLVLESLKYELKNDGVNSVKSFDFGTLSTHINTLEFDIFTDLIFESLPLINSTLLNLKKTIFKIQNRERELVLQLLIAGNQFDINYDPPVVSKLATIVRLSKTHVRENRSWRICARLRHIFVNLPDHWTELFMEKVENDEFTPFDIASHQFFDCFKKWINIEKQVTDNTYLYRRIFLNEKSVYEIQPEFEQSFEVLLKHLIVKIAAEEEEEQDSLNLRDVSFTLGNKDAVNKQIINADIGSLFGKLGSVSLNLWFLKEDLFKNINCSQNYDIESPEQISTASSEESTLFDFNASVALQRLKLELCLDEEIFEIINHDTKMKISEDNYGNLNLDYSFGLGNVGFRRKNLSLFGSSLADLQVNYSNEKNKDSTVLTHHINTDLNSLSVITSEDSVKSVFILESTARSFTKYRNQFERKKLKVEADDKSKDLEYDVVGIQHIFKCHGSLKTLKTNSAVLQPLVFDTKTNDIQWEINSSDRAEVKVNAHSFSLDLSSHETLKHYLLFTQNNLDIVANVDNLFSKTIPLVINLDLGISLMKFMFSDLRSIGESLVQDICAVEKIVLFIKSKLLLYGLGESNEDSSILFNTAFDIEYFGILFDFSSQQIITELMKITFGIKNCQSIDSITESVKYLLWYYGVDSFSMSINDQLLKEDQSKIFNTSFSGYVANSKNDSLLDFNLESKFFRIMFTPFSLMKFLWFVNQFENFSNFYSKQRHIKNDEPDKDTPSVEAPQSTPLSLLDNFESITCVSSHFSLGWIYTGQGNNENNWQESGIVYGYEVLSLTHNLQKGEIKLENSFMGATPFSTYDSFQKIIGTRNYINFLNLPLLSINYNLKDFAEEKLRDLNIDVYGDKLQTFFCENMMMMVKNIIDSVTKFKKLETRYIMKQSLIRKKTKSKNSFNKEEFLQSLGLHRIQCKINYVGGYCSILSHKDFLNAKKATVFLHSPKVSIAIDYNFISKSLKKHRLSVITNIGDSENLLYPTAVPILNKLLKDARALSNSMDDVYDRNGSSLLNIPIFKEEYDKNKEPSFDIKVLLNKFELYFKIECGSQVLSLTCEPKAKVEAVLGVEKMIFKAETAIVDSMKSISVFFDSNKLSLKFHHIFSNTISSYFQLSKFSLYAFLSTEFELKEETFSIITANSLDSHVDITQIQDVNLFFDIWNSNSNLTNFSNDGEPLVEKPESRTDSAVGGIHKKNSSSESANVFSRYYTNLTFAICFMLVLKDVKCIVDFGPTLGCVTITGTKLWFEFTQHSNWSREFVLHVNDIILSSVGRLQGLFELKNFNLDTSIKFPDIKNYSKGNYYFLDCMPFIKFGLAMESLKTSLSLDYHAFLLTEFADWKLSITNEIVNKVPTLTIFIDLAKIEFYATALVTANLLSIFDSLEKIKSDNLKSYYDILHDSNTVTNESSNIKNVIQSYLNALNKNLKIKIGDMYVQISPHSLVYPQVLILENKNTIVDFSNYGYEKIFSEVEISTEKLLGRVTKSALLHLSEDDLREISISEYQKLAKKSKGGTIVNFPSISTKMSTWKASGSNIIEFIYSSTFGGLVNIKWNLGPVGFIRDIWSIHAIGLKQINDSRIEFTSKAEKDKKKSFFEEENLDERIKKVKLSDKYEYKPLVVPIIDTPNLQDLGNATPPLRWFGINKQKFPGMIYETLTEPLQDLISQIENEYGKTLNKL